MTPRFKRLSDEFLRAWGALTGASWFRILLPLVLAALALPDLSAAPEHLPSSQAGGFLLAGLPCREMIPQMPFFYVSLSALLNLGLAPGAVLAALHLCVSSLSFLAGWLLGGYWAAILALVGIKAFEPLAAGFNYEQLFYSISLLLVLCALYLKKREGSMGAGLLCALSIGASLLSRSPLFLFPFFVVCLDWLQRDGRTGWVRRQCVFLGVCYVLLLPWGFLNYSLSGKAEFLESAKAGSNIITAALGSVYTLEGDARGLAGLGADAGASSFLLRQIGKDPLFYALTTARRVWHIFLFQPLLFGLFFLALALNRSRDRAPAFLLPVYFVFIHSLLSIEGRYFFPMVYLLPPLIAGTFVAPRGLPSRGYGGARAALLGAAGVFFVAVFGLEAVVAAYPWRAARNPLTADTFSRASLRFPGEKEFHALRCRELWFKSDDAGYYSCLGAYGEKFGDKSAAYFLAALAAPSAEKMPEPVCGGGAAACINSGLIKTLREFELGDQAAAEKSLGRARAAHQAMANMLRAEPYKKDRELAALLKRNSASFDNALYNNLILWPAESMGKILAGLEKAYVLPLRLEQLRETLAGARAAGITGGPGLRALLAPDLPGGGDARPGRGAAEPAAVRGPGGRAPLNRSAAGGRSQ